MSKSIDLKTLRDHLLVAARRILPEAEAEDLVQDVLLETEKRHDEIEAPDHYARAVLKKRALGRKRALGHMHLGDLAEDDAEPCPPPDLDALRAFAALGGALEQLAMWGDGHQTHLILPDLANFDPDATRRSAAFYDRLLEELPVTERHQRRLAAQLAEDLQRLQTACGYIRSGSKGRAEKEVQGVGATEVRNESSGHDLADFDIDDTALATMLPVTSLSIQPAPGTKPITRPMSPAAPFLLLDTSRPSTALTVQIEEALASRRTGSQRTAPGLVGDTFADDLGRIYIVRHGRLVGCEASVLVPGYVRGPEDGQFHVIVYPTGRPLLVLGWDLWRGVRVARHLAPTVSVREALVAAARAYDSALGSKRR